MYLVAAGRRVDFANIAKKHIVDGLGCVEAEVDTPVSQVLPTFIVKDPVEFLTGHDRPFLCFNDRLCAELSILPGCIGPGHYVANMCYDKHQFAEFMMRNFPRYYPAPDSGMRISKPRFGNSSKGIYTGKNITIGGEGSVVQKLIKGKEYSVDCFFDHGEPVFIIPRTRDRVAGGEVVDSKLEKNDLLIGITDTIGRFVNYHGPACFQYMVADGRAYLFEINARFGGGSTLSLTAFSATQGLFQSMMLGSKTPYGEINWNLKLRRTFRDHYFAN